MKTGLILTVSLLFAFVMFTFTVTSGEEGTFYWYRDFNGDSKPDQRITLVGDFTMDAIAEMEFESEELCSLYFSSAGFLSLYCGLTPCPAGQLCYEVYPYPDIQTIWLTDYGCICNGVMGESTCTESSSDLNRTYVYVKTDEDRFQLLSMNGDEFASYLMSNFQVVETVILDVKEGDQIGEACETDAVYVVWWRCDHPEEYCPTNYTCVRNPDAVVLEVITEEPFCVCQPTEAPILTNWGLMILLVILTGVATWVVLKRRRVVTA